jgi:hypothetical protein
MGKSGDPRKREQQVRGSSHPVEGIYWQPFRHKCGCYLEWGAELPHADMQHAGLALELLRRFLRTAQRFPCPLHGSATGVPAEPLLPGQRRYMPANGVWYKECPADRQIYGDRLADHLSN